MQNFSNEEKIDRYLNELSSEYKELLLNRLIETSDSIEELKVSELLRIDAEIKKPLMTEYRLNEKKHRRILMAGMLYLFMGIMLLLLFEMSDSFYYEGFSIMALVLMLVGAMLSLFSLLVQKKAHISRENVSKRKKENNALLEYRIVKKWREFEGIYNDIYLDMKILPNHSIVSKLHDDGYVNKEQMEKLRKLLRIRNDIVHGIDNNYTIDEINNSLKDVEEIVDKIKNIYFEN